MQRPWTLPPRPKADDPLRLTFAPLAWLKLLFFCHAGPTEVGGFAVAARDNLLSIEDFVTVPQHCTAVGVRFDDDGIARFFDDCVNAGLTPDRFARVWCHTHPYGSATPSFTDEGTFARCFGRCDWAVMFILTRGGTTYARLRFNAGPGGQMLLPVEVDWAAWPTWLATHGDTLGTLVGRWPAEYDANVRCAPLPLITPADFSESNDLDDAPPWWPECSWCRELDKVFYEPTQEQPVHDSRSNESPF